MKTMPEIQTKIPHPDLSGALCARSVLALMRLATSTKAGAEGGKRCPNTITK